VKLAVKIRTHPELIAVPAIVHRWLATFSTWTAPQLEQARQRNLRSQLPALTHPATHCLVFNSNSQHPTTSSSSITATHSLFPFQRT